MAYVYILQSLKNRRYYIGSTNDLNRRLHEHREGKSKYTRNQLPVELVFSRQIETILEARKLEYKLKRLKSKIIIDQIISDGYLKMRR